MNYRRLGKTGLMVSEIGLGAEWLERHNAEECAAVIDRAEALGINILDCWMCEPKVRSNIGAALAGRESDEVGNVGGGNISPVSTSSAPASDALRGDMTLRPVFCAISIRAFLATPPPLAATL